MGSCEPCQVGNQAALSSVGPCAAGQPVLSGNYNVVRDPQVDVRVYGLDLRVILIGMFITGKNFLKKVLPRTPSQKLSDKMA